MERVEREGVFVQTGDLIYVVGSAITGSGQFWLSDSSTLNEDIVYPLIDGYEIDDYIDCSISEANFILEAIRSGQTVFTVGLFWVDELIRIIKFVIYVN